MKAVLSKMFCMSNGIRYKNTIYIHIITLEEKNMKNAFTILSNWLGRVKVNEYQPLRLLNVFLAVVVVLFGGMGGYFTISTMEGMKFVEGIRCAFSEDADFPYAGFFFLVGLVCFAVLIYRNRKIGSIPKMILYTLLQLVVGAVACFIGLIVITIFLIKGTGEGMRVMNGTYDSSSSSGGSGFSLGGGNQSSSSKSSSGSARDYTSGQDELARSYGFADSEQAKQNGIDTKTML